MAEDGSVLGVNSNDDMLYVLKLHPTSLETTWELFQDTSNLIVETLAIDTSNDRVLFTSKTGYLYELKYTPATPTEPAKTNGTRDFKKISYDPPIRMQHITSTNTTDIADDDNIDRNDTIMGIGRDGNIYILQGTKWIVMNTVLKNMIEDLEYLENFVD